MLEFDRILILRGCLQEALLLLLVHLPLLFTHVGGWPKAPGASEMANEEKLPGIFFPEMCAAALDCGASEQMEQTVHDK